MFICLARTSGQKEERSRFSLRPLTPTVSLGSLWKISLPSHHPQRWHICPTRIRFPSFLHGFLQHSSSSGPPTTHINSSLYMFQLRPDTPLVIPSMYCTKTGMCTLSSCFRRCCIVSPWSHGSGATMTIDITFPIGMKRSNFAGLRSSRTVRSFEGGTFICNAQAARDNIKISNGIYNRVGGHSKIPSAEAISYSFEDNLLQRKQHS